jgi:hypothetical protein
MPLLSNLKGSSEAVGASHEVHDRVSVAEPALHYPLKYKIFMVAFGQAMNHIIAGNGKEANGARS